MRYKLILILLFIITTFSVKAQVDDPTRSTAEQLKKQLSVYLEEHPSSNLYLHLDKNIYAPKETIWFKAYLLSDTAIDNKVLYLRIANEHKEVVLNGQFPMYDIRAHGDLKLPERLTEGKYTLYAYTDRMLSYGDTNVFVQQIRIRKTTGMKLEAEAMVSDTTQLVKGGKVQVMARVMEGGKSAKNIKGEYELISAGKTIKYGRLNANQFGESFINFTYPDLADHQLLKVNMLFTRDNDYAELSLNLPHKGNPLKIAMYPEGGQMVSGVAGKVIIEVLDMYQNPVSTELLVKKAGQLIAKISTNKLGTGSIILKPEAGSSYTVETTDGRKEQIVAFPEHVKPQGYSLKLYNSKDQCRATVYNVSQPENALLVLRSNKEILWSKSITIPSGDSISVTIPAADFPKNILSLAIFDHENKPKAERLFLNREEDDYKVTILIDRHTYGMQKKVRITVNITDTQGNPVVANLSVAATEKNRIDSARYGTILQSWYYRPFGQASTNRILLAKSASEIDGLLMAGNLDNQWSNISNYISRGLPHRLTNTDGALGVMIPPGKKKITRFNIRPLKSGLSLSKAIQENISFPDKVPIQVDADNMFFIPSSSLLSQKGEDWILDMYSDQSAAPLNISNFMVKWKDHDILFDSTVVKGQLLLAQEAISFFSSAKNPIVSGFNFNNANQLAEVIIGAKEATIRKKLKDECPDWICSACGFLNCPYKPAYKPVKGKIYDYSTGKIPDKKVLLNKVIYLGCGNYRDLNYIKNITIPVEFPLPDYDNIPSAKEDTRSTIYWTPNIVTDTNGTATFSFFTSDIMGEFEIRVQGLEVNTFKPLMGTGSFIVNINN